MKKIIASFLVLAGLNLVNAQDNYTLKSIVKVEGMPDDLAAFAEMEITTYVKGNKTKSETTGMMFSNTVYYDNETLTYLADYMGHKTGYVLSKKEIEENEKKEKSGKAPKIEYTNDKKTIAGFECTKAILTTPSDGDEAPASPGLSAPAPKQGNITIVWITDKIKPISREVRNTYNRGMNLGELKGTPLEMQSSMKMQGNEVTFVMTTKEVLTTKIEDSIFMPNTEGYTMMTYHEMKEKMKMSAR